MIKMVQRVCLLLCFTLVGVFARTQILEEMTVKQLGTHIDSLLEIGEISSAYDHFYTYTNYLPRYNHRVHYREELLSIQKRVENAPMVNDFSPKEKYNHYYKERIGIILKENHYQKIIYFLSHYKDSLSDAAVLFDSVYRLLPNDTIDLIGSGMPMQLYKVPLDDNYYNPNTITDSTLLYMKKDSTLYTGVLISRYNDPQSMETEIAGLNYDRFENGKRVERRYHGYAFSNSFYKNQLFYGYDSSHYRLNHMVIYDKSDTIRTYFFGYNEELIKEQESLNQKSGANNLIKEIEYNLDGTIKKWKELAPISEKHNQFDSYWCWVNQFGDTISDGYVDFKDGLEIYQERSLNANGDTINLSRTVNSFLDGLQIENRQSSDGLSFELRYVFDNGKLIDIHSDSVLYFNEDWNIISEEDYIELMNQENDYSYFYSGIFKEYFPEVDFNTHAYFLAVSDIGHKNYKQFKKAVRKYFKVKI